MTAATDPEKRFRHRLELRYAAWARTVAHRPWTVLISALVLLAALVPQARLIEADTHPEKFLAEDHPVRAAYYDFKDRFGADNFILITIEADDWFTLDRMAWLRDLHEALETEVPHVEEITSLVNARVTRGEGDELIVEDLFEDWPETEAEVQARRAIVRDTELHQRLVIGDDERHVSIMIELSPYYVEPGGDEDDLLAGFGEAEVATDAAVGSETSRRGLSGTDEQQMVEIVFDILDRFERPDHAVFVSGFPPMNVEIVRSMGESMALFFALSIVAMIVVLATLFRRASGVVLPLLVVVASLASTAGFIGLRGAPVNFTVQILPSFLLAVGASAAIHLLVIFFRAWDGGDSKEDALAHAMGHAGLPITMACLTTAAGLASFLASELVTVRDIGTITPVGIGFCLVWVLTVLPALLVVAPLARRDPEDEGARGIFARAIVLGGDWSVRHPGPVLATTAVLGAVALVGAVRIEFDANPLEMVDPSSPLHESMHIADTLMGGTTGLELIIDSGEVNGFHDPARQRALEAFADWIEDFDRDAPFIRKTMSVNDVLQEIHQALNENQRAFHTTPDDRSLIAQELLLFENSGSDDLEDLVDSEFRMARFTIRTAWMTANFLKPRVDTIVAEARARFPDCEVRPTGLMAITVQAMHETYRGTVASYLVALLTITPMMMLLVGTLRGGLSSMVPNLLPVAVVLGIFGYVGEPLEMFTTMTGAIAIGLAVDDTIHFFHAFYREFAATGDTRLSVRRTLESTGRALLTTTIVLSIGFAVFIFAPLPVMVYFGATTTLAILFAFLADVLISPALVTLATRGRQAQGVPPIP